MRLIVLSGYSGSGKDTFPDYLVEKYGYEKHPFAASLKKITSKKYKLPINYFYDEILKDKKIQSSGMSGIVFVTFFSLILFSYIFGSGFFLVLALFIFVKDAIISSPTNNKTPRDLLIKTGAELRNEDPLIFIKETFKKKCDKMIISDCRLPNELKYIKENYLDEYVHIWINRSEDQINKNDNTQIKPEECQYQIENKSSLDLVGYELEKKLLKQDEKLKKYFVQ